MAGDTGGRVIDVRNEKGLEKAFDVIIGRAALTIRARLLPLQYEARRHIPQNQGGCFAPRYENPCAQGLLRAA